ncbi:MAG TPA: DUF4019 domain-containing protein [Malonomonas sp.]
MFPRKYRIHAILIVTFLFIVIYPQYSNKPDENKTAAAKAAALEFLQMVDAGQSENSWLITAAYLRENVALTAWQEKLVTMRTKSGPLVKRELTDASFTAPIKDRPDSLAMVLTFDTEFQLQQDAEEKVTLLLDTEKGWQVVGYFIN